MKLNFIEQVGQERELFFSLGMNQIRLCFNVKKRMNRTCEKRIYKKNLNFLPIHFIITLFILYYI